MKNSHLKSRVTGIGWVNASGSGRGKSNNATDWPAGTPAVPASILKSLKGGSRFGRLDLFSQIGVAAIGLALQDAGHLQERSVNESSSNPQTNLNHATAGLISATTSSCSLTDHNFFNTVKDKPHLASPGLFVYTLATSFLGEAALRFSLTGLTMAVIEPRPNATDAICLAIEELNSGDDEKIVAGICNLFQEDSQTPHKYSASAPNCPDVGTDFKRSGNPSPVTGGEAKFEAARFSFMPASRIFTTPPASGALFLVLENDSETALTPKNRSYATLSCDPKKNDLYCNNQPCPDIFSLQKIICG